MGYYTFVRYLLILFVVIVFDFNLGICFDFKEFVGVLFLVLALGFVWIS